MFKTASIIMAPDGDPAKYRASIKTSKLEITTVVCQMMNFDQAAEVAKDLVQNEGVQSIMLCPGFPHGAVAKIANAVGEGIAVIIAWGDVPSTMTTGKILAKEGWLPERH